VDEWIVVTGSSGHVGRAISWALATQGFSIFQTDKNAKRGLTESEELSSKTGVDTRFHYCDFESAADRTELANLLLHETINIKALVNNAAVTGDSPLQGWSATLEKQSLASWRKALEINLTAPFELSRALVPKLKESSFPSIINIASIHAGVAPDWHLYEGTSMNSPAAYSVSKAGLVQLTRWLASALAPEIRVNCVSPGGLLRAQDPFFINRYVKRVPLQRMGEENDVAAAVSFLVSEDSKYMTGQNLCVDGGYTLL
jgi:NAD(P)-dependent dehydrogenase (short-subunit alcohol dehydrogenase family)